VRSGHGTFLREGTLVASVAGLVHRVNRVVSVRPVSARYVGEVGDVVVGRVTDVGAKRWRVDVRGRQDAVLLLSGLYMGEGAQRRMTAEDQLSMRKHLQEGDLVSADVHTFFSDGGMSLHARSGQYGRMENGCAVSVAPFLIQRLSAHFVALPCGVDMVVGMNGVVWVAASVPSEEVEAAEAEAGGARGLSSAGKIALRRSVGALRRVLPEERRRVARVSAAVACLGWALLPVTPASVMAVYSAAEEAGVGAAAMADPAVMAELVKPLSGGAGPEAGSASSSSSSAAAAGSDDKAVFDSSAAGAVVTIA